MELIARFEYAADVDSREAFEKLAVLIVLKEVT